MPATGVRFPLGVFRKVRLSRTHVFFRGPLRGVALAAESTGIMNLGLTGFSRG